MVCGWFSRAVDQDRDRDRNVSGWSVVRGGSMRVEEAQDAARRNCRLGPDRSQEQGKKPKTQSKRTRKIWVRTPCDSNLGETRVFRSRTTARGGPPAARVPAVRSFPNSARER